MAKAWYIDNEENWKKDVTIEELCEKTGILYWKINMETWETDGVIEGIRKERVYGYQDIIEISAENTPNYEERVKGFYTEHCHTEEELQLILKGQMYFDVRDKNDNWIRIHNAPGDLMVFPKAIYNRAKFVGEPTPLRIYRLFKAGYNRTAIKRHATGSDTMLVTG